MSTLVQLNSIVVIARMAHQTNKAWCEAIGDTSQKDWDDAPEWQRESAVKGVQFLMNNQDAQPQDSHNSWLRQKIDDNWKYGPVKDAEKKEHPCMVPYDQLPLQQQMKDYLFQAVVKTMINKYREVGKL